MSIAKLPIIQRELVLCFRCRKFVYLIATIRGPSGKRIPLDDYTNKIPHKCLEVVA